MAILHLPACPICGTIDSLVSRSGERSAYTCEECGSIVAWLGDDFWLHGDRWVLQYVGREEMRHLQHRPLTVPELRDLAESARAGAQPAPPDDGKAEKPPRRPDDDGEVVDATFTVLPSAASGHEEEEERPPYVQPEPAGPERDVETALVPMAQVLPEGLTLAVVRYDGSHAVPVAVFEEGQLRALDPALQRAAARRRGRGSPMLAIGVGWILVCLLCALAVMFLPVLRNSLLSLGASPSSSSPGVSPVPVVQSAAAVQGCSDYDSGAGSRIIVGEVLNRSSYPLSFIQVLARFYGDGGQPAGSSSTFAELATLEPGGTAPFALDTQGLPPFARYELLVEASPADQAPLRLEVSNQEATQTEGGAYQVTGEVRNSQGFPVRFAEVVATYYSASNQVLRVKMALARAETLEPGQSAPFELILENPPADLSYYKLQTQAVRQ